MGQAGFIRRVHVRPAHRRFLRLFIVVVFFGAQALVRLPVTRAVTSRSSVGAVRAPAGSTEGNGLVAFASTRDGNSEIYTMNLDGNYLTNVTHDPAADIQPAWSSDGKQIAFTSDRGGDDDIWMMNADGSLPSDLTNLPGEETQPTWNPVGRKIAFTRSDLGNDDIYSIHTDGTGLLDLTNNAASDRDPAWSPDGTKIAFTSNRKGNDDIYVMNARGGRVTRLTRDPASDSQPSWSPDGAFIAFTSNRDGNDEIYVISATGADQTRITTDPASDTDPVFAPDKGYRIIFTSNRDGNDEIYVTWNVSAGQVQYNLTQSPGEDTSPAWQPLPAGSPSGSPIHHVVILYQENHSFDNVLGRLCVEDSRCDGAVTGQLPNGSTIPLATASDDVPIIDHDYSGQVTAIDGGKMDGFAQLDGCGSGTNYQCYSTFDPSSISLRNVAALTRTFTISDRTFETDSVASWGSHLELVSSYLDGFYSAHVLPAGGTANSSHGCDSGQAASWWPTLTDFNGGAPPSAQPSCIPDRTGFGPYRASPVPWTDTLLDRMDEAGVSWHIYAPGYNDGGYGWAICPTYAECLYGPQASQVVPPEQFPTDAAAGSLPAVSIVIPRSNLSQHNGRTMSTGDDWIAQNVNAVMNGPDWSSTAIFLTWDDCGCFYDHVPPPPHLGIRVPMIIIGPYAKPAYTDSNVAGFISMMAFIEHTFGLAPLTIDDATAYDFSQSFDFTQSPLPPMHLELHGTPPGSARWAARQPDDPNDST